MRFRKNTRNRFFQKRGMKFWCRHISCFPQRRFSWCEFFVQKHAKCGLGPGPTAQNLHRTNRGKQEFIHYSELFGCSCNDQKKLQFEIHSCLSKDLLLLFGFRACSCLGSLLFFFWFLRLQNFWGGFYNVFFFRKLRQLEFNGGTLSFLGGPFFTPVQISVFVPFWFKVISNAPLLGFPSGLVSTCISGKASCNAVAILFALVWKIRRTDWIPYTRISCCI